MNLKNKKGELSINMIVIVAICLIILVIMVMLVSSRGKSLDKGTECASLGGVCKFSCSIQNTLNQYPDVCNQAQPYCCNPLD